MPFPDNLSNANEAVNLLTTHMEGVIWGMGMGQSDVLGEGLSGCFPPRHSLPLSLCAFALLWLCGIYLGGVFSRRGLRYSTSQVRSLECIRVVASLDCRSLRTT